MYVSFYLKRTSSKNPTAIFARISYGSDMGLKYYLPESIHPVYWNKTTHRAKETVKFPEYPEFNARLDNISARIKTTIRKMINDGDFEHPTPVELKEALDRILKGKIAKRKTVTFLDFFTDVIDQSKAGIRLNHKTGKPISVNTIKTYSTALEHLRSFQTSDKEVISFSNIDLHFYSRYTAFLIKKYKLSTNSIGKDIQIIKLLMNEAAEHELHSNFAFKGKRFITVREKADTVYLTKEELEAMIALNLSDRPKLDRVRDSFIIGCYTGLRFSDFSNFNAEKINGGFIELTQTKTGDPVVIPIHTTVDTIVKKYCGKLPNPISNQKMNKYLKEITRLIPMLRKQVEIKFTKAGEKQVLSPEKCDLISTHTARRSFATNEFLAGTPTLTIMAITGHRTEKAFLRYIRVTPSEHAKLLKQTWEKRNMA
ncbi:Site-specific recombinase XerD [Flavisolibacter ginsengisoli DSM 18119]|jgi:integrase|uniref:Site-specific recombinase XerD n=2 Tax=Flavisolibacter TaxID=398041 RepID=A0A1M5CGS0_9BACT|nr:Site-specific recombinase XerD [Flavisolibacter ginsengisoli DSM 18119]